MKLQFRKSRSSTNQYWILKENSFRKMKNWCCQLPTFLWTRHKRFIILWWQGHQEKFLSINYITNILYPTIRNVTYIIRRTYKKVPCLSHFYIWVRSCAPRGKSSKEAEKCGKKFEKIKKSCSKAVVQNALFCQLASFKQQLSGAIMDRQKKEQSWKSRLSLSQFFSSRKSDTLQKLCSKKRKGFVEAYLFFLPRMYVFHLGR